MHLGPQEVLLNMDIEFDKQLNAAAIVQAIDSMEQQIRSKHPNIKYIFIEAESITACKKRAA